jgi:nucleotide-binding universal stress UspA family protein
MAIEPMGPVVVGVDGSRVSMEALDLAAEEAAVRVTPLVVVHAGDPGPSGAPAGRRLLGVALSRAWSEHPALSAAAVLAEDDPVAALVRSAEDASMLVVGHNGHCSGGTARPEPVAHRLVGAVSVPLVVHRTMTTAPVIHDPRPVLVAVAAKTGDDAVLEFAFAEAALRGAPLRALYVAHGAGLFEAGVAPSSFAEIREAAEAQLDEALTPWSEKYPEVPVERILRHGVDVSVAATAASRSAQLVVVGSPVRHGARPTLSVAQILVHRAGCSVAVVPIR